MRYVLFASVLLCVAVFLGAGVAAPHVAAAVDSKAGMALFVDKGCTQCHGAAGEGGERGPDLRGVGKRMTRAQIETQIHDGGGNMPAFGDALEPDELKLLTDTLTTWKKPTKLRKR